MQTIMARRPVWEFVENIREHVDFGRIMEREESDWEESDWEISGAHNSHNFLKIAAESVNDYPRSLFQLCKYKDLDLTVLHHQARENEAFELEYKMKRGGILWVKSLYNPRSFSENRLFHLAEKALNHWLGDSLSNVRGNNQWFGSAVEGGKRYKFKGRYREVQENTYIVTTYYLSAVTQNGRGWRR